MICSVLFAVALIALIVRLGYVQIGMGGFLQDKAFEQHTRDRLISPTRGTIYDRTGKVLAQSGSVSTIGVVHAQITDPAMVAKILSEKLEMNYDEVYKKVTKRVAFERIKTKVDKDIADEIRNMNLPGVKVDEDSKRYYPYGSLAAQVIGFVGKDNQGIVGLEVQYDSYLKGTEGKILMETNGHGERREEEVEVRIDPENGTNLVTTLDVTLQEYAAQAIEKVVTEKQAKRGSIVLMNPQNGEIYAMANYPTYDLNEPFTINDPELSANWHTYTYKEKQDYLNAMWRNFTINDTYEPGSTFKVFTSAMGLESGVITPESEFNCNGSKVVGGRTIKCWRSPRNHGHQTFVQGVQNSCNPVFMEVGERIGATRFHDYMVQFGFKKKTGVDLPGEAVGIMYSADKMGPVELATMSFGQSFQITPLQLLSSASAIINGGYTITPHFGKEIVDDSGNVLQAFEYDKGEQIISTKTSDQMRVILESVVSEGTGSKTYIPGYRIGGKTATSQKLPRGSGKYIASFMAFAPADDPQVIGLVLIDEPKGVYYGGAVAGPVMQTIMANTLPYLGIEPVYNEAELKLDETQKVKVPDFRTLPLKDAKILANSSQVLVEFIGSGDLVLNQFPLPGEEINKNSKILLYTE
ncbi:penicillin-binding transpeptidase domain-containing protein [Niameybacter massiliensis]|uniref:Penicillin-binding transpeptidase domain-containing protein n=2 Tax=Clostridia TaxID=186801 RepID=A0AA42J1V9_9FIRM|nr:MULTISPECIES: penicillin-binding transpeptidase domain-containing protein [Lachnospirales]MDA3732468.1 penicillin-binding transpeptidase domain-containing protein [Holtiella tumoricola]